MITGMERETQTQAEAGTGKKGSRDRGRDGGRERGYARTEGQGGREAGRQGGRHRHKIDQKMIVDNTLVVAARLHQQQKTWFF